MRDLFEEIFTGEPLDPMESARKGARPLARRRFYKEADVGETGETFPVLLDGKPIRTPARRILAAPTRALAEAIAAEWNAQTEFVDPFHMPLTRLANAIIDGVAEAPQPVADEIAKYLASDLMFYRAGSPARLVALQSRHWDPVVGWARDQLGARFVLAEGVIFVEQPAPALAAARAALPDDPWRLGALSSITTITGSALLALALWHKHLDLDAAWAAAHVDEDWNIAQWGEDELAAERRAARLAEVKAAETTLRLVK